MSFIIHSSMSVSSSYSCDCSLFLVWRSVAKWRWCKLFKHVLDLQWRLALLSSSNSTFCEIRASTVNLNRDCAFIFFVTSWLIQRNRGQLALAAKTHKNGFRKSVFNQYCTYSSIHSSIHPTIIYFWSVLAALAYSGDVIRKECFILNTSPAPWRTNTDRQNNQPHSHSTNSVVF